MMVNVPGNTTLLQNHLRRLRAGHASARDDLLKLTWSRLDESIDRMIRNFPRVRRCAVADDRYIAAQRFPPGKTAIVESLFAEFLTREGFLGLLEAEKPAGAEGLPSRCYGVLPAETCGFATS